MLGNNKQIKITAPSPVEPFLIQLCFVLFWQESCFPLREHVVCINEISSRDVIGNVLLMCKKVLNNLFRSIVANYDFFKQNTFFPKLFVQFSQLQSHLLDITLSCRCSIRLRRFRIFSGCYSNFVFKNYVYLSKFNMVLKIHHTIFLLFNHLYEYELGSLADTHQCLEHEFSSRGL